MKLYRETDSATLQETNYRIESFKHEVDVGEGELDMHKYFIQNRNTIFGQYLYLLHEVELSPESYIDFVAFTESGAVLLIEIKRGADTRNRQEVVSQLGKYAMDAYSLSSFVGDNEMLAESLSNPKLQNKRVDKSLLSKVRTNVQNSNLNLFLITEDATDELVASIYYLSYGKRNQKISVIELKRFVVNGERYCITRQFNKQSLLNSTRKSEYSLQAKMDLIADERIRTEMERIIEDWLEMGFNIAPLSISTPEYLTFEWKKGQSSWVYFYVMNKEQQNLSGSIHKNSLAFYVESDQLETYQNIIEWAERQRNFYRLETNNRGRSRDYYLYCINISDYESDEIDAVLEKVREVAIMRRENYLAR